MTNWRKQKVRTRGSVHGALEARRRSIVEMTERGGGGEEGEEGEGRRSPHSQSSSPLSSLSSASSPSFRVAGSSESDDDDDDYNRGNIVLYRESYRESYRSGGGTDSESGDGMSGSESDGNYGGGSSGEYKKFIGSGNSGNVVVEKKFRRGMGGLSGLGSIQDKGEEEEPVKGTTGAAAGATATGATAAGATATGATASSVSFVTPPIIQFVSALRRKQSDGIITGKEYVSMVAKQLEMHALGMVRCDNVFFCFFCCVCACVLTCDFFFFLLFFILFLFLFSQGG